MTLTRQEIAAELARIAEFDSAMEKRIEKLLRQCPADIKARILETSLGTETEYAKDAAFLSDLLSEEAEAA